MYVRNVYVSMYVCSNGVSLSMYVRENAPEYACMYVCMYFEAFPATGSQKVAPGGFQEASRSPESTPPHKTQFFANFN